jgi:hypothetical protein
MSIGVRGGLGVVASLGGELGGVWHS